MAIFRSLHGRLILLVTLATLPALVLLALSAWYAAHLQQSSALADTARLASLIETEHERLIGSTLDLLRTMAEAEEVRGGDRAACGGYLRQVLATQSVYDGFARIAADGRLDCSAAPDGDPLSGGDAAAAKAWARSLAAGWAVTRAHPAQDYWVEPYRIGRLARTPEATVVRRLVDADGTLSGYLVAALGTGWLRDGFAALERPDAALMVTDGAGTVLARLPELDGALGLSVAGTPLGRALRDERASGARVEGLDGVERIYGIKRAPEVMGGAVLAVGLPVQTVLQLSTDLRTFTIVAIVAALGGIAVAARYGSRHLVLRWTDRIMGTARHVTGGDYTARVGGPYDRGELGELARTIDRMLDEVARREADLHAREEWFSAVVQHSTDMITILDAQGNFRYLSPAVERVLGYEPTRLEGTSSFQLIHVEERGRFAEVFRYLAAQPGRVAAVEHRQRHADGHFVHIESVGVNLLGTSAVAGVVLNSRDVTRRRRIEEMLRLVTSAVDQSSDGVLITSAEFGDEGPDVLYANPAMATLTGLAEHELIGATLHIFQPETTRRIVLDSLRRCLDTGEGSSVNVVHESRDWTVSLSVLITPLKDHQGELTHCVILCRDITEALAAEGERQQLEATLRQALKMEAVGTLAGGIAHDFNNVLLPMMMLTQLTLNRLPPESRERQDLQRVLAAQHRAKALVGQILAFSRGSTGEYVAVDLAAICRETMHLLRASLPATVTLIDRIEAAPTVRADPTQLQQVLMNLCSNSAQAMPSGKGSITVSLEAADQVPDRLPAGSYCRLVVEDDGTGIPVGIVERIFDPFFTTKEVGVGTGLGLSVVHGIVSAHKGAIELDTWPGEGTRFTIYLPVMAEAEVGLQAAG